MAFGADDAALRAQAAGLSHVRFVGKVGDVPEFLSRCDVVVVPSRWEAFGQVVAEAKMAGRAVLVADVDGMPEQVGNAGVVADCSTAEALAAALAALPAKPLAAMGKAGREIMARRRARADRCLATPVPCGRSAAHRQFPDRLLAAAPTSTSAGQKRYASTSRFSPKL